MTFDESNAKITNALVGRTVEYVYRDGKDLVIRTMCGHELRLASDVNHDVHCKRVDVRIVIPSVGMTGTASL